MVLNIVEGKMPSFFDGGIDVVDVEDVADGHIRAMEKGKAGESYNLGTEGNFTMIKNLFSLIAEAGGVKPPKLRVPISLALLWAYGVTAVSDYITGKEPVATPGNIYALSIKKKVDFSKAVSGLGIPQTPLSRIVEKTVRWYRDNGYFEELS